MPSVRMIPREPTVEAFIRAPADCGGCWALAVARGVAALVGATVAAAVARAGVEVGLDSPLPLQAAKANSAEAGIAIAINRCFLFNRTSDYICRFDIFISATMWFLAYLQKSMKLCINKFNNYPSTTLVYAIDIKLDCFEV